MFEEQVLPVVRQRLTGPAAFHCRVLKTVGVPESIVEEMVAPGVRGVPGLELGYCARLGEVDVRLIAADAAVVDDAERRVREVLGRNLCGTGDDRLEAVVVALLAARGQTVALAESCTGGAIAHRLTNVSGASAVFRSGWVAYANATKTRELGVPAALLDQHGAVSEPVARAMAEGARQQAGADYALSATGIAGPTGGTPAKPVGLVFIGLAGPRGTIVRQHQFGFDRESFKQIVSQHALDLLRRELLG
jgi:nicotinamide-nucleotide amidase